MIAQCSPARLQLRNETIEQLWRRFDQVIDSCETVEAKIETCRKWFSKLLPDEERLHDRYEWALAELGRGRYGKRLAVLERVKGKNGGNIYYITGGRILAILDVQNCSRFSVYAAAYRWDKAEQS